MKSILFVLASVLMMSCGGGSTGGASGPAANLEGFDKENAGNGASYVSKKDASGNLLESGYVVNGSKSGNWMTYYSGKDAGRIKTIASYTNGILNGPYFELSTRGQIESQTDYQSNKYHGMVTTYKFGRPLTEKMYKNGNLDGVSTDYYSDGVIQKEINFKDGKQHGTMKWFNEEGELTMEYEYKNGEKVSGGIVDANSGDGE